MDFNGTQLLSSEDYIIYRSLLLTFAQDAFYAKKQEVKKRK